MFDRQFNRVLLLPSFLCLDAPLVAAGWSLAVHLDSKESPNDWIPKLLLLFSGVWAVYLSDRLYDSYRLQNAKGLTERHQFAIKSRPILWIGLVLAVGASIHQLLRIDDTPYIYGGTILAIATITYFAVFRLLPSPWCLRIPGKEIMISVCFALGVMLTAGSTEFTLLNAFLLAGLSAISLYNCLIISYGESAFDAQHDPQAFYATHSEHTTPSWPVWACAVCGCLLLLFGKGLITGSSLIIAGAGLFYLSRRINPEEPASFVQAGADAILFFPWPIVLLVILIC